LPDLLAGPEAEVASATGTDGAGPGSGGKNTSKPRGAYSALTGIADRGGDSLRGLESPGGGEGHKETDRKPLSFQGGEAGCEPLRADDSSSPTRTRTWNKPVNSRLLYH